MWPEFIFGPVNLNVLGRAYFIEDESPNLIKTEKIEMQLPWIVQLHEKEKNE